MTKRLITFLILISSFSLTAKADGLSFGDFGILNHGASFFPYDNNFKVLSVWGGTENEELTIDFWIPNNRLFNGTHELVPFPEDYKAPGTLFITTGRLDYYDQTPPVSNKIYFSIHFHERIQMFDLLKTVQRKGLVLSDGSLNKVTFSGINNFLNPEKITVSFSGLVPIKKYETKTKYKSSLGTLDTIVVRHRYRFGRTKNYSLELDSITADYTTEVDG